MKKSKKIKAAKKIPNKWAEGPTIAESYNETLMSKHPIVWKHRIKGVIIDAPSYVRGPPKTLPPHDMFLEFLEFRMRQKPTFIERIFGKRMLFSILYYPLYLIVPVYPCICYYDYNYHW